LLRQAVEEFDANGDGAPGDFINSDGLIDVSRFDAQGHRGGRDLRPENTLPAMEVALDSLMSTLELDNGITSDRVAILDHDPLVQSEKCRRADGAPYTQADEVLVKDLTAAQLQSTFVCDKVFRGPQQTNDPALSPASVAFATSRGLISPYVAPTLQQVFNFVRFYADYYRSGPGSSHPDAERRWRNAERVRFNIETKINPRREFSDRTIGPKTFARTVASTITANELEERADIQSFDFRTLLEVQKRFPEIRTVYLFGDFPIFDDPSLPGSDDGTNLQDEKGRNTPWLAGLFWPYRVTALDHPFRSQTSGGFEGMALSSDRRKLLPLLERPLTGGEANTLLIHEFDLARRKYTGGRYKYALDPRGTNIGDFIMFTQRSGLVIERDGTQGNLNGFKAIYQIKLPQRFGEAVEKTLLVDLLRIKDPFRISGTGLPGDVGLGEIFAFPFTTIEDVFVLDPWHIGVLNDNNFPFSVGRHVGAGRPDDNEFIIIRLGRRLN
jgi:glycerophosphoryl diester phosphodiesterase